MRSDLLANKYFSLLGLVLPITSVVLFPGIKGTTPAYFLCILILAFSPMFGRKGASILVATGLFFLSLYLYSLIAGLAGITNLLSYGLDPGTIIGSGNEILLLRDSTITQSLYLVPCIALFFFTRKFYGIAWDKFIAIGAVIIATYGYWEFFYFLATGQNGDFLSNRTFGDGSHAGSAFQTMNLGGYTIMRIKSLTGEPSMYAFTMVPLWIFLSNRVGLLTSIFLLGSIILSTSTTAFFGLVVWVGYRLVTRKLSRSEWSILILAIVTLIVFGGSVAGDFYQAQVVEKLSSQSTSGAMRSEHMLESFAFFARVPILTELFGLGFGVIRSEDMLSTLLVNTGIFGVIVYSLFMLYPVFKLRKTNENISLKISLLSIYVMSMTAVSEFSYLTIWLISGISYNALANGNSSIKRFMNE